MRGPRDDLRILAVGPQLQLEHEPTPIGVVLRPRARERLAQHRPPRVGLVERLGGLVHRRGAAELEREPAVLDPDLELAAVEAQAELAGPVRFDPQQARARAHELGEQLLGNAAVHRPHTLA
jgi:hypothetical protein